MNNSEFRQVIGPARQGENRLADLKEFKITFRVPPAKYIIPVNGIIEPETPKNLPKI